MYFIFCVIFGLLCLSNTAGYKSIFTLCFHSSFRKTKLYLTITTTITTTTTTNELLKLKPNSNVLSFSYTVVVTCLSNSKKSNSIKKINVLCKIQFFPISIFKAKPLLQNCNLSLHNKCLILIKL